MKYNIRVIFISAKRQFINILLLQVLLITPTKTKEL